MRILPAPDIGIASTNSTLRGRLVAGDQRLGVCSDLSLVACWPGAEDSPPRTRRSPQSGSAHADHRPRPRPRGERSRPRAYVLPAGDDLSLIRSTSGSRGESAAPSPVRVHSVADRFWLRRFRSEHHVVPGRSPDVTAGTSCPSVDPDLGAVRPDLPSGAGRVSRGRPV